MSMDYGVKELLLQFIEYIGSNPARFEKECGLANGYVRNIRKSVSLDKLEQISKVYEHLNRQWLLTGEGEMLLSQDGKTEENEEKEIQGVNKEDIDKLVARVDELVHTIGIMEQNRATEIERTQSLLSRMLSVVENMTASLQHHSSPLHCTSPHSDAE